MVKTRNLTASQRANLQKKSDASKKGQKDLRKVKTKLLTAKQRAELQTRRTKQRETAQKVSQQFKKANFKTVQQAKDELKKYKKENPTIGDMLSISEKTFDKQQQDRIKKIDEKIKRVEKQEQEADKDGDKAREEGYEAEARELKKFKRDLKSGKIFDVKKAFDIADDAGDRERRKESLEQKREKQLEKISKRVARGDLPVNKIEYKDGKPVKVEVQGVSIPLLNLSNKQRKNIKLSSVRVAEQKNELKSELEKATKGKKPDTRKLFNLGFTGNQVTEIVAAYETGESLEKVKNANVDKLIKELQESKGRLAVDPITQERVYKIKINQILKNSGKAEVPFSKNTQRFQKEYEDLLDERKKTLEKLKDTSKVTKSLDLTKNDFQSLKNKALTGQSLTPNQLGKLEALEIAQGKKLQKQQIKNFKKLGKGVLSPVIYGMNLRKRYEKGENNPLFNDFSKVFNFTKGTGTGALKETGDIINSVFGVKGLTINSKGKSFDGIVAKGARSTLEYMQSLIRESTGKDKKLKTAVKSDLKNLWKGTKEVSGKVVDAANVARKNPFLTMLTVAAAIEGGVIKSKQEFLKNPSENTGRALVWLFPGTIIKGAKKATKLDKINLNPIKYSENKFTISSDIGKVPEEFKDLVKKKTKTSQVIKGKISGTLNNKKPFNTKYALRYYPEFFYP